MRARLSRRCTEGAKCRRFTSPGERGVTVRCYRRRPGFGAASAAPFHLRPAAWGFVRNLLCMPGRAPPCLTVPLAPGLISMRGSVRLGPDGSEGLCPRKKMAVRELNGRAARSYRDVQHAVPPRTRVLWYPCRITTRRFCWIRGCIRPGQLWLASSMSGPRNLRSSIRLTAL
jgi:hypothetical protein